MPLSPVVLGVLAGLAAVGVLALTPMPLVGLPYYNVDVNTTLGETCVLFCSYSVQSVNPSVTGPAEFLDFAGWFGLGIGAPCIDCQYKVVAQLSDGQSSTASETKFVSNLFNVNYVDTLNLGVSYVHAGSYGVTVTVYLNGGSVATGSGTLCVAC